MSAPMATNAAPARTTEQERANANRNFANEPGIETFNALAHERLSGPLLASGRRNSPTVPGTGAIVCLTRGYGDLGAYQQLIERNQSIYRTINYRRRREYPLIIWHEGNISSSDQRYILAKESNADVRFVNVSGLFILPKAMEGDLQEHWPAGYRLMCRFHTYHIWQCTMEFEYVLRVDEDCVLMSVQRDPIEWLARTGIDFAASAFIGETHALTNRTLSHFIDSYRSLLHPQEQDKPIYNHFFPYTNLYVTRTPFWRRAEIQRFLYAVIREPNSLRFRWGDLPVLGVALNLFGGSGRAAALIPDLVYRHRSHGKTIASNGCGDSLI